MAVLQFEGLLLNQEWLCPAYVEIDDEGIIKNISQHLPESDESGGIESISGYALPGFQNAHSHAFQYAMAGLAEVHPKNQQADNFWTWRNKMYQIALTINPAQMEAIAAMLYSEMLRHGYTHVAEFHYLHHDQDGSSYNNLAETGERLIAAAHNAGIKITLIPMFYQKGGFNVSAEELQRRFISKSSDDYWKLLEASKAVVDQSSQASLAFGVHSLRAVHEDEVVHTVSNGPQDLPFHIHIAEQLKEVQDCVDFSGKRSVEYLFDKVDVSSRFHLVHATHLNDNEVRMIAQSGAHVVLCPTTEGNLGDGLFRFRDYKALNGNWSIGTDSHVSLDPLEELRLLDYGQRLISHQRDTFVDETGDSGLYAINNSIIGGRKAMGNLHEQFFAVGQPFDAVVVDAAGPLILASSPDMLLSTILYSGGHNNLLGTIIDGKWVHRKTDRNEEIIREFSQAMSDLGVR